MAEESYRRLTRARIRRQGLVTAFATRSSLWLGKDHLLSVDSTGYTEDYKRFYFRDIQAVTWARTKRRLIWNCVLAPPTALCGFGWTYDLLSRSALEPWAIVLGFLVTSIFAVPLLLNNLLGPTCVCQLRTAVQTEQLPSLSRMRRVRRVLDRIRPLIAAAQGQLAPEEIPERMRRWVESPAGPGAAGSRAPAAADSAAPPATGPGAERGSVPPDR
jgi:hypothetical protein